MSGGEASQRSCIKRQVMDGAVRNTALSSLMMMWNGVTGSCASPCALKHVDKGVKIDGCKSVNVTLRG